MTKKLPQITSFYLVTTLLFVNHQNLLSTKANDTIDTTQSIKGYETLVSSRGRFELGFFSPGNSNNYYIGIWYKNVTEQTPVWVANRENPVRNIRSTSAAALKIIEPGTLVVIDEANNILWSSNTSTAVRNPIVQLLDTGNLVLREANNDRPEDYLWQSFDYLTDTYLPDMDFGWNYMNGKERYLSSWRSNDDPAPGDFTFHIDPTGYPQGIMKRGEAVVVYRNGPWNGEVFSGTPRAENDPTFKYGLYSRNGSFFYRQDSLDSSVFTRVTLTPSGVVQRIAWVERTQTWASYLKIPGDQCDNYRLCGAYGLCVMGKSIACSCLDKFVPQDPRGWARLDWSNGCVRRMPLNDTKGDGFLKYSNIKLPDARMSLRNETMTIKECKVQCLKNYTCMAYTNLDIRGRGSGCIMWFGDLVDMRVLPTADGQDLYIRVASSELESDGRRTQVLVRSLTMIGMVMLALSFVAFLWRRKMFDAKWSRRVVAAQIDQSHEELELPFFDMKTILRATDNFSINNKLGEGGYGPVYKGLLEEGHCIAVKRLSVTSTQGLEEFKNEVSCISKLQHRNLVKLLGYCIDGEERMLVYEYMPNKSLDCILFNEKNRKFLDSHTRFQIVKGIARGLMYLHQDSRLRIVHRDLKASNILLDKDMNPKISDFGLARCFKDNETEDKTKRVAGTYGYMSPEYAVKGQFSIKSDVFSFGVLVLEIVSGKRTSSFDCGGRNINLLGHAWMLHKEGRSREFVDSYLRSTDNIFDMLRLIRVGLLCVQHSPHDRPTMSSVVSMLSSGNASIAPKEPGFFIYGDSSPTTERIEMKNKVGSRNEVTITILDGR